MGIPTDINIPCKFHNLEKKNKKLVFYSIAYNESLGYQSTYFTDMTNPYPKNEIAISVKKSLDEALILHFAKGSDNKEIRENFKEYKISQQTCPKFALRFFRGASFVTDLGSFIFSLAPSVIKNP